METITSIHRLLRLDLLQSHTVAQFPNKIFYHYPNQVSWSLGSIFDSVRNKVIIEKDLCSNSLWFDNIFFEEIKSGLPYLSLHFDENESLKNFLQNYFFQFNESIGKEEFNPSEFGNGMQIKIADEYARSIWDSLMD
jgi:hypothetical protein